MPVFINEVVIRASVRAPSGAASPAADGPAAETVDRERADRRGHCRRCIDQLERELDRIGER